MDHPRLRGKDQTMDMHIGMEMGSPPLARERPFCASAAVLCYRITPACAGKTRIIKRRMRAKKDHPRLRGKDGPTERMETETAGSPPLARERHWESCFYGAWAGITPACAGKTRRRCKSMETIMDHPRLRGKDEIWAGR